MVTLSAPADAAGLVALTQAAGPETSTTEAVQAYVGLTREAADSELDELAARHPGMLAGGALALARADSAGDYAAGDEDLDAGGQVDELVSRHPEIFTDDRGRTSPRKPGKARPGRKVTSRTRAHAGDLDDDPTDTRAPSQGGVTHPAVAALLGRHRGYFEPPAERPGPQSTTIRPLSPAARETAERRARAGHQPGRFTIPDLAAGRGR